MQPAQHENGLSRAHCRLTAYESAEGSREVPVPAWVQKYASAPGIVHVTAGRRAEVPQLGAHLHSKGGRLQAPQAAVQAVPHDHARAADRVVDVAQVCYCPCVHRCLREGESAPHCSGFSPLPADLTVVTQGKLPVKRPFRAAGQGS